MVEISKTTEPIYYNKAIIFKQTKILLNEEKQIYCVEVDYDFKLADATGLNSIYIYDGVNDLCVYLIEDVQTKFTESDFILKNYDFRLPFNIMICVPNLIDSYYYNFYGSKQEQTGLINDKQYFSTHQKIWLRQRT